MAFRLPEPKCYAEPHVHIEAPERGLRHQARVGRDFHGFDGYRRALILRWHGIEEYPIEEFADLVPDPTIERRLKEYAMTDDPASPIEENVEDPDLQDDSPDLPPALEGNEDDDDSEEKQDQQTG